MMNQAVFLDKDGTLIEDVPYNVDPAQMRLVAGAGIGLQQLHQMGYQLIVISNQSGVARGYFSESALAEVEQRLQALLAPFDVSLDGFYYCPHHPDGTVMDYAIACECRKPAPGLLMQAARDHGIDLTASWFIGDILNDVEAGRNAGCQTVLLNNGNETEWLLSVDRVPHYMTADLAEAAAVIEKVGVRSQKSEYRKAEASYRSREAKLVGF
ncbi:MAG: HAD family hydrolase [Stenomitos rutilans HA7619-LM2]|jgi:D,D-heptose 1,7-bisphosphate phosphatase|nr:HAD family hydrolase [Stenomitos rutilans HA7619-LM2]